MPRQPKTINHIVSRGSAGHDLNRDAPIISAAKKTAYSSTRQTIPTNMPNTLQHTLQKPIVCFILDQQIQICNIV